MVPYASDLLWWGSITGVWVMHALLRLFCHLEVYSVQYASRNAIQVFY